MLTALVLARYNENIQTITPKSMILDLGWFDGDRTKFEDWWRGIWLFLKSNKVVVIDNKITTVLAWLRGGIAGIYMQKKINELEDEEDTQDWEKFVKEIKIAFSNKSKVVDAEWKIKTFWQNKKYIADFIIKFDALVIKAETNNMYTIFLLKKNVWADIIKTILGYPPIASPDILKEWKIAITSVGQEYKFTESWYDYKTETETIFGG